MTIFLLSPWAKTAMAKRTFKNSGQKLFVSFWFVYLLPFYPNFTYFKMLLFTNRTRTSKTDIPQRRGSLLGGSAVILSVSCFHIFSPESRVHCFSTKKIISNFRLEPVKIYFPQINPKKNCIWKPNMC